MESCIIVGAGISGLLAAQRLCEYEVDVTILEKSRGYGGRMATKIMDDMVFDTGAQFMTTRETAFRERVEKWLNQEEVLPWYKGPLGNMRYVGKKGMTQVPERIGKTLNVKLSERVSAMKFKKGKWTVTTTAYGTEQKTKHEAEFLILTPPVPQSLALINQSNVELGYDDEEELKKISYLKCLTVIARLNGPAGLPNPGAIDLNHDILRWIGDNSSKGISAKEGCITIHSSPKFAEAYWDRPEEDRIREIMAAAKPFLKSSMVEAWTHRWAFSDPTRIFKEKQPFRKPFLIDESINLGMCGDGFNGPRIEAAAMSGMRLADALLRPL